MKLPKTPQRTTPGFAFSLVERAIKEGLAPRQFGNAEIGQILAFFESDPPECVYCGTTSIGRWDHLVAIHNGGSTVLGNMVPACSSCADSKGSKPFDAWMRTNPKFYQRSDVETRIARLQSYAQRFGYEPHTIEEILSPEELTELAEIRRKLSEIRAEMQDFLDRYQNKV